MTRLISLWFCSHLHTEACRKRGLCHLGTASASGGVGRGLGKGLLSPFCQHLSQTQSPQASTPSEGWDAPSKVGRSAPCPAHPRARAEPPCLAQDGRRPCRALGWTITALLLASVTLEKNPAGLSWRLSWRVWDALPSLVTQFSVVPKHWCRHQPGILGQHLQHDLAH